MARRKVEEALEERLAREIAHQALGVDVEWHDQQQLDAQPDARILYPGDRVAYLETVTDIDPEMRKAIRHLQQHGSRLPSPIPATTWIAWLQRGARIDRVREQLPGVLETLRPRLERAAAALEDEHALFNGMFDDEAETALRGPFELRDPTLSTLGISRLTVGRSSRDAGEMLVMQAGEWTDMYLDEHAFSDWVDDFLVAHPSKAAKLDAMDADEGHLFLWATFDSPGHVGEMLRQARGSHPTLPARAPRLPAGITHLWVGLTYSLQAALRWSPERGWERVIGPASMHGERWSYLA